MEAKPLEDSFDADAKSARQTSGSVYNVTLKAWTAAKVHDDEYLTLMFVGSLW